MIIYPTARFGGYSFSGTCPSPATTRNKAGKCCLAPKDTGTGTNMCCAGTQDATLHGSGGHYTLSCSTGTVTPPPPPPPNPDTTGGTQSTMTSTGSGGGGSVLLPSGGNGSSGFDLAGFVQDNAYLVVGGLVAIVWLMNRNKGAAAPVAGAK